MTALISHTINLLQYWSPVHNSTVCWKAALEGWRKGQFAQSSVHCMRCFALKIAPVGIPETSAIQPTCTQ
jgi:hypothetical protein